MVANSENPSFVLQSLNWKIFVRLCLLNNWNICKSHQPTLLCMVNESHSVKKHFCEKELGDHPIKAFFVGQSMIF